MATLHAAAVEYLASRESSTQSARLAIVIPAYNDWDSLFRLIPLLDAALANVVRNASVFVVDDGSNSEISCSDRAAVQDLETIDSVEMLHLVANVGHQRAIAIGLTEVVSRERFTHVLVMDADGEDRPAEAARLIEVALKDDTRANVFVAQRKRRSEGVIFRGSYGLYKFLFRALSGQLIDFGNFVLLPIGAARRLIHIPETWNHIAASLVKSRLPLRRIPTARGQRLAGRSTMNMLSLVTLGLSAISVYSEAVFVRMFVASVTLLGLAGIGIAGVAAVRFTTNLAIPGWATTATGLLAIMLVQALTLSMIAAFLALSSRSGVLTVPASVAAHLIERRELLVASEVVNER